MRMKLIPVAASFCFLGMMLSFSAWAAGPGYCPTPNDSQQLSQQQTLEALSKNVESLERQIQVLKSQLKRVKAQQSTTQGEVQQVQAQTKTIEAETANNPNLQMLKQPMGAGSTKGPVPITLLGDTATYIGGIPITTSPYLGVRSQFNASDLIVNITPVNEDLRLLTQLQKIESTYCQLGLPVPIHPYVDASGELQVTAAESRPYMGRNQGTLDLTDAELDITAILNPWVMGFMTFNYDNTPPVIGPVYANSRVFMDRGFFTIGNLSRFPFYLTAGQLYVPFGLYTSNMITTPLTQIVGRIKARAAMLGFNKVGTYNGVDAQVFAYRGYASSSALGPSQPNDGGANLDYTFTEPCWNILLGVSVVNNIADSQGLQQTGAPLIGFNGFGGTLPVPPSAAQNLVRLIPGFDVHGNLGVGNFDLVGEYLTATREFSPLNLAMNGRGALPRALNAELAYTFPQWTKPTTIAVGYSQTEDALALLLPAKRFMAAINTSFWRDTIESIEYNHDINYNTGNVATGQGVTVVTNGLGHTSSTVSVQMSIYF